MIIDNQTGLTCDITGNCLDIYLDENNNSFGNIDDRRLVDHQTMNGTPTFNLPQSTFSFKASSLENFVKMVSRVYCV